MRLSGLGNYSGREESSKLPRRDLACNALGRGGDAYHLCDEVHSVTTCSSVATHAADRLINDRNAANLKLKSTQTRHFSRQSAMHGDSK